ncbi:ankyrin repeat domain-containing protein [Roseovarius aestuarii]|uniref:Ankyrin repeats (3 copies) n=1 Tax=Roseovarius aestuarii TaxID=475083 RepID=A0A1X7BT46_9RHOB|nr:ankyrin repeat domain-containing protein [Roseovarius aestuarii]SMC12846.1 Ankyrin repeats (3 copies) [Roseovarius aestuarii]
MRQLLTILSIIGLCGGSAAQMPTTPDQLEQFFKFVQLGDTTNVQQMLEANPSLAIEADRFEFQAIHVLDYNGFDEVLALLLHYGADINAQSGDGSTLLHILIDAEFLPLVLEAGADLELKDGSGFTPLLAQISRPDSRDMVLALLAAGSNPNVKDNWARSALSHAQETGDESLINILVDAGAVE